MSDQPGNSSRYDVVIVGGALSGAATAILLLEGNPALRILIVEKAAAFSRRVGEATVEVSSYFLTRVLGLTQHLNESHLVKQGMRFWFYNKQTQSLPESSEFGGRYLARIIAFQVDRSILDEEVLRRACAAGAELLRPASVTKVRLEAGGDQQVWLRTGDELREVRARWVVDASGVAALLARQQGWWRPNTAHPTTAVWARWKNVKDWDGIELARKYPKWSMACHGIRGTATNHLTGDGWWAWCIPLKGGDVSVGVVFDQRLVPWPEEGSLGERLKGFLCRHPVGRELLTNAQWIEGDVHWRKNLAYDTAAYAGDGFALVGDAAAFLDPLYSPGMDWVSFSVSCTVELILAQQRGADMARLIGKHNRDFAVSYERWFGALYKDKYEYVGEYDLMRLAFLLDLGLYYLGVVAQPFKRGARAFLEPLFSMPAAAPAFYLMRTYNRRFARMARERRRRGVLGRTNKGERFMFGGYTLAWGGSRHIARALGQWFWLELREGWRSWFRGAVAVEGCAGSKSPPVQIETSAR